MIIRLEVSNKQLVARVIEQREEMRSLRDGMKIANAYTYDDVMRAPRIVTLLVGNSLVRDIDMVQTAGGMSTDVRSIVVVGGTKEAMGNVSIYDSKE